MNFSTFFTFCPYIFEIRKRNYSKNVPSLGCVLVWTFLCYPNEHKYVYNRGLQLLEKLPSSSHLGGNHKTDHFYPKIGTYPIYSEAHIVTKGNEFLHNSVTHGVG